MDKSTLSVIIFAKIIYFVIILLSQTVVRTLSRQPFFYTVRYSFPLFCTFPGNRKTRRTEVLRVSYVWTQRYLAITNLLYMRQSHDFVVRSRAFVKCHFNDKRACKQAAGLFYHDWRFIHCFREYYSMIVATRPDPTVRPPSRIAKRSPCSIATGWISSIVISTLSPGMHISVPSGSSQTPVTSVVRK